MEDDQGGGFKLSKKLSDKGGEVDYKTKAGTAWSHNFLNQKPWHPLSYPNQRRKWIAEQTHAQKERRAEEVAREYAQEQEFLRQTALISKKEKEKMEMMRAVSFMYVKPPGYNPESAKAAEVEDEKKKLDGVQEPSQDGASSSMKVETIPSAKEKKKPRPKDVFGRALPTQEQFEILKNAPRLETGVAGRAKPFGVEIRNVKCLRCGNYGHQSGDRECPLKDMIMPNEENRLKRDDPLTAIQAQTDCGEPLKWELKQKPGMSPPHGGFNPNDPNQQIVAEDIFDEYGGFLGEANIQELLTDFSSGKAKKKSRSKHRRKSSPISDEIRNDEGSGSSSGDDRRRKSKKRYKKKKRNHSMSSSSESLDGDRHRKGRGHRKRRDRHKRLCSSEASESDELHRSRHHHNGRGRDRHPPRHRHNRSVSSSD